MPENSGVRSQLRDIGAELRDLRTQAGLTMRELATAIGMKSHAYISKWESGAKLPDEDHVVKMLNVLNPDADQRSRILGAVRQAQGPGRVTTGSSDASDTLSELIAFERDATRIVDVATTLIPGLLQTMSYTRSIMSSGPEAEKRALMRMGRREILNRRRNPAKMLALIDTEVLSRPVAPAQEMTDQLHFLLEMAARPNITIQLVSSRREGFHPGLAGSFELIEFKKASPVVLLEHWRSSLFLWDPDDVREFVDAAEEVRNAAMTPEESSEVIAWLVNGQETM